MIDNLGRFLRTVRHLSPVQVAHRAKLRLLLALDRWADSPFEVGFPAARERRAPPLGLLYACPREDVEARAAEIAEGRFRFLDETRDLGPSPFPPPAEAALLWSYHLEYMDYLLDLAVAGDWTTVEALVRARLEAEPSRHLAGLHPYPTARRVAAWARVLSIAPFPLRERIAGGVFGWATRVARRLEFDVGGNHLLENGLALVLAGAAFRGRSAAAMLGSGARILTAGTEDQVLPDGGHFELSPGYHARVLSVLLEGGIALAARGASPGGRYFEKLFGMLEFLRGILDPEGALPLLGDTSRESSFDPGRFLETAADLLPGRAVSSPEGDRAYPDSGLYILEDPVRRDRMLFDAGPACPPRLPAHGQADTFTYELHIRGVPFVVDAGLFEYAPGEMREYCRSTRAHSTVTVDGRSSSEVWSSFRIGRRANVVRAEMTRDSHRACVVAEHDGYDTVGVRHARAVARIGPGVYSVADRLYGPDPHRVVSRIHLHPEAVVTRLSGGAIRVSHRGVSLFVVPFGVGAPAIEPGWHCPRFGERRKTEVLAFEVFGTSSLFGYVLAGDLDEPPSVSPGDGFLRVSVPGGALVGPMP